MRVTFLVTVLWAVAVGTAATQPYGGDFLIAGQWYLTGDTVARIDRTTLKVTTFVASLSTVTSRNYHQEIMMAENNADFFLLSSGTKSIYRIDPQGNVVQTVFDGSAAFSSPYDMILDQNAEILVVDYSRGLLKVNPAAGTAVTLATTVVSGTAPTSFRYNLEQDPATGLVYTGTCCSTASGGIGMMVLDLATKATSVLVGPTRSALRAWYAHRFDRRVNLPGKNTIYASVNGFGISGTTSALVKLTLQGVITTLVSYGTPGNGILTAYGMEIGGSRNLVPIRITAPNYRQILVSFPGHPGQPYVAALSLHGVRPGVPLGDGRQINLVPDDLTVASLHNALPALWRPGPGKLDTRGRAVAHLDLNLLGKAVRGVPVWVAAAVLDPKAPKGFAAIAETVVIRME